MDQKSLLFVAVLTDAGGEGKTLISLMLAALFKLAKLDVVLLDGDQGNFALKVHVPSSLVVGWGTKLSVVPQIMAALKDKNALFDTGANFNASNREICDVLDDIVKNVVQSDTERSPSSRSLLTKSARRSR